MESPCYVGPVQWHFQSPQDSCSPYSAFGLFGFDRDRRRKDRKFVASRKVEARLPHPAPVRTLPFAVRGTRPPGVGTAGSGGGSPFRPGASGLFWSARGGSSQGDGGNGGSGSGHGSPPGGGPDGGPCDLFGSNSADFIGGPGSGGGSGGSLSSPSSFSFFSFGFEYGEQRRSRSQSHSQVPPHPAIPTSKRSRLLQQPNTSNSDYSSEFLSPTMNATGSPDNGTSSSDKDPVDVLLPETDDEGEARSPLRVATYSDSDELVQGDGSGGTPSSASPGLTCTDHDDEQSSEVKEATLERQASEKDTTRTAQRPHHADADETQITQQLDTVSLSALSSGDTENVPKGSHRERTPTGGSHEAPGVSGRDHYRDTFNSEPMSAYRSHGSRIVEANPDSTGTGVGKDDPGHRTESPKRRSSSGSQASSRTRRQVRALFEKAKEEERSGRFDNARMHLLECLALDNHDAHSWLALARLEARSGGVSLRPGSPIAAALSSSVDTPARDSRRSSDAPKTHGRSHQGQHTNAVYPIDSPSSGVDLARQLFEEGVRHCPENVHLLQAWGVLEHRCGNLDEARKLFARGLELEADNPYVCQAWGLLEQRSGNTEAARSLFSRSVALHPHPEVCSAWAVLEAREGRIERARELFQSGLDACKSPESAPAAAIFRAWAEIEERVGDLICARELLSKALAAQPRVPEAFVALARLDARRGYVANARELIRTAMGLSRKPPAVVFNAWAQIELSATGKTDEAMAILEQGHKAHPNDPSILQTLGTLEEKRGNCDRAKQLFAMSIRVRPMAPAFVAWALLEEKEGNYVEAVNLFEQALATDALHGAAYNAYGMMEARRGELDRARAVYERGLKMHASASVYHGFGQLELKQGRNADRARQLFEQGVAQTREDTSFIWHSWGMLELGLRNPEAARRVFREALKRYPHNSRVLVGAALAHASTADGASGKEEAALGFFKRAVAADPTHAHAWQAWGVFEQRRGRKDAAQALFKRGLRMCPTHGALWQAWGVLETTSGNFTRARQLFTRGAESCPLHVHLFQAWACMEVRVGNIDRAKQLLDRALESDYGHGPVWNAYGLLEARHGTLEKARQNFVTGISRAPNHAPLYRAYGQTEARAGNFARARELFTEGLRRDPMHAPLYHAMAEFEGMVGNLEGLALLKEQAEHYFGSKTEASMAIRSGEENKSKIPEDPEDGVDYDAKSTPMELALDNM